jgi:hypothetical protein
MKEIESKKVKLRENEFLASLTSPGSTYQDFGPDTEVLIVAVEGFNDDWAAYFRPPWLAENEDLVRDYGSRLPEEVACDLFPEWAKRLKWRP